MAEPAESPDFLQRLHHEVPAWVKSDSCFHVRLRVAPAYSQPLTHPEIAAGLLGAVLFYLERLRWNCRLFLLMPDHAHALLAFSAETHMSRVIGEWKHYASRQWGIDWQSNFLITGFATTLISRRNMLTSG